MGRIIGSVVFLLAVAGSAHAYVPTVAPNGARVRWKTPKLNLAANIINQSGITSDQLFTSVVRSLQRWESASGGSVQFDYWQGTDRSKFVPASAYDGLSSLYFISNAGSDSRLSSNVLGLTQVWYNTSNGQILETDIALNDQAFYFTTRPRDTSGYGSGSGYPTGRNVFVENVITHELGHAFGLSHSASLQSTMLFMESPEQAFLSCDDEVAVRALYAGGGNRGQISGTIVNESGSPVFGAHVLAISRRRGTVLATAITDPSGRYAISALEPGEYFLIAEPFYAGAQTLPSYYAGVNSEICGMGRFFSRTALTGRDGFALQPVTVRTGQVTGAPKFAVRCGQNGGASIVANSATSVFSSAPEIGRGSSGGFGVIDRFNYSGSNYYRLSSISGHLEIRILSYSLYSPTRATVSLTDAYGNDVYAQVFDRVYAGESGYVNFDTAVIADNLPLGDYYLRVGSSSLQVTMYPGGSVALDSVPFVVITGSINEGAPALSGELPFNARCRMDESFRAYSSPPGDPVRGSTDLEDDKVGFCGRIGGDADGGGAPGGGGSGPNAAQIVGWFLPFMLMGAGNRFARYHS